MSSTSHILERIWGIADVIIVSLNEILNLLPDFHSTGYNPSSWNYKNHLDVEV